LTCLGILTPLEIERTNRTQQKLLLVLYWMYSLCYNIFMKNEKYLLSGYTKIGQSMGEGNLLFALPMFTKDGNFFIQQTAGTGDRIIEKFLIQEDNDDGYDQEWYDYYGEKRPPHKISPTTLPKHLQVEKSVGDKMVFVYVDHNGKPIVGDDVSEIKNSVWSSCCALSNTIRTLGIDPETQLINLVDPFNEQRTERLKHLTVNKPKSPSREV